MSKLTENTLKIQSLLANIEQLPEDRYWVGKEEGRAEGEAIGYDNGYEQGNTDGYAKGNEDGQEVGYADALAKRTELVVTASGEYEPTEESTGFKKVTVDIEEKEDLDAVIAEQIGIIEELSTALDGKLSAYGDGYDDALSKLTEITIVESGEYEPENDNIGFKKVVVDIKKAEDLEEVITEQAGLIDGLRATLQERIGAYDVGYDAALEKLTDLVVTENGEYAPEGEGTGFKSVSVNVPSEVDAFIDGTLTKLKSGVTSIRQNVFYEHPTLTEASFPNATSVGKYAFYRCENLTKLSIPNLTSIEDSAFRQCHSLTTVDFPHLTSVPTFGFGGCSVLTSVNLPNVTYLDSYAFQACKLLLELNFPKLTSTYRYVFERCEGVKRAIFNSLTTISDYVFRYCYSLETADFPSNIDAISSGAFADCKSLKALILRGEKLCRLSYTSTFNGCCHILGTVNSSYNPEGLKDGYFYVPKALLSDDDETKDYRRATNWSTFATQFRALEDYTIDGTITGELDPNKI